MLSFFLSDILCPPPTGDKGTSEVHYFFVVIVKQSQDSVSPSHFGVHFYFF